MKSLNEILAICPVCNANLKTKFVCRRCKTDLTSLINMRYEAILHRKKAVEAYEQNRFPEMFVHARRSHTLNATSNSAKLLASASLLNHRFKLASFLWKREKMI